jgi:hypothetical protein
MGQIMSAEDPIRDSILHEHTLAVAQHDQSLHIRARKGFRRLLCSKLSFKGSKYDRRKNPTSLLKLRSLVESWPKQFIAS